LKSCSVLHDHYDDERDNIVVSQHNIRRDWDVQEQDHSAQDQDIDLFLVSDRSCRKTDGLRPHHWLLQSGCPSCRPINSVKTQSSNVQQVLSR